MIYMKDDIYYRICDDCGNKKEIQRQTYLKHMQKSQHFCLSCMQRGERNHQYGKPSWNKGLTKELDDRVKRYGENGSIAKKGSKSWNSGHSYEELKGQSWAKQFKSKVSKNKKGVPNYKRRYSTAYNKSFKYFREACKNLLYPAWIRPVLERDDYKCAYCGSNKELEVHHVKPFRQIIRDVANELSFNLNEYNKWPNDEFEYFRCKVIEAHKIEDGITLCKDCHKKVDKYRRRFLDDKVHK